MIRSGLLLKLASKFEEEVERAADTLRSGQLPAPSSKEPKIDIIEVEPYDHPSERHVDKCISNLLLAKYNIEKAFTKVREFDPEVADLFYNIDRYVEEAESAYNDAIKL